MRATAVALAERELAVKPKVRSLSVAAHWLTEGDCRLDATFYGDEAIAARRVVDESGFEYRSIGDRAVTREIFNLNRFRRIYTADPTKGWPYLSASEVMMFRPKSDRWIARDEAPDHADRHFAKEGWLLVTSSGVVGRCILATKRIERFFLTHDLLRIVPTLPAGYLYAYLSSSIGQALMAKEQYGMTVTHLEPHHVARLPVPLLPEQVQRKIHEEINRAYGLRDEANQLLDQADELLHRELGLAAFDESQVPYIGRANSAPSPRKLKAFAVKASELAGRLDVSFHLPTAKACIAQMGKGKYPLIPLGDIASRIFIPPRFKRIYVAREHGIPFLRPSDITMMKPCDLKYLSRGATDALEQLMLRVGDIMVTTDGTVGRTGVVPKQLEGWSGSNNIARIVYGVEDNRNGYVAALLMTSYGFHQLTREIYGAVVDHLEEEHIAAVLLPDAPLGTQRTIGTQVVQAFEKKEQANEIENKAIAWLENTLRHRGPIARQGNVDAPEKC
ncbi:MAG: hypothetical protein FJ279_00595 [Planctomycetes bacterium]|nr:hypothetical protein [Planctomycetota bacterium]